MADSDDRDSLTRWVDDHVWSMRYITAVSILSLAYQLYVVFG